MTTGRSSKMISLVRRSASSRWRASDGGRAEINRGNFLAQMERNGLKSEKLDERRGKQMLRGVLLHVVNAARPIHVAVDGPGRNFGGGVVNDVVFDRRARRPRRHPELPLPGRRRVCRDRAAGRRRWGKRRSCPGSRASGRPRDRRRPLARRIRAGTNRDNRACPSGQFPFVRKAG